MMARSYSVREDLNRVLRGAGSSSRITRMDMELTERCNNDCIHCCINRPANDQRARAREMSTEQVTDILDQAAALGCLEVRITGGEPLLRPDMRDIYLYARRLGMKVLLFTNARLITPELADLFSRVPPLEPIEVTVYGMRKESCEAVTRSPGSFSQFRRGVSLLQERGVPFIVKSVLLPQTAHEMSELEAWAATIPWMTRRPSITTFLDLRSRRDDPYKNLLIESLRPSPEDALLVLTRDETRYRQDMNSLAARFMGPPGGALFTCGAAHGVCVDAYGRAQPCMSLRAPEWTTALTPPKHSTNAGDAPPESPCPTDAGSRAVSLVDALHRFRELPSLRANNAEYLSRCARCFLKGLCEQCPARSWAEHGTLDTPVSHLCEMAHAQARYLSWLGKDELGWEVENWRERVRGKALTSNHRLRSNV